ncbi:PREDICTED: reverse mRNAase [Prunus dulcis]|nr:hypothetical protein L3X38_024087 [Prunus dulcis]VVA24942.1 PREDICTED: reverse mRNAase [Prunus dulcis]
MGAVKVVKAKANVYSIIVGDEKVARRLVDGNPWFVKGHTFTTMLWPLYHSLDDIAADMAVYWVQAHGLPRNLCTSKNARVLGARVGAVMEVEDIDTAGFRGFIRIRVNLDASKPLSPGFTMPCPVKGKRLIRLRYEGLRDFCYSCGKSEEKRLESRAQLTWNGRPQFSSSEKDGISGNNWVEHSGTKLKVNGTTVVAGGSTTIQTAEMEARGSATIRTSATFQFVALQRCTNNTNLPKHRATLDDYREMRDPESFSTQDYNGTLTVAMNGLAKDRDLCDPMRVPPWALTSATWANITANMEIVEEVESGVLDQDVQETQKQRKGKKICTEDEEGSIIPNPPKKAHPSTSPGHGCSLRLSNRRGRGLRVLLKSWKRWKESIRLMGWRILSPSRVVVAGPNQPQGNHDTTCLELSRVGEPLDSSVFEGTITFQKSHGGVFDGN